MLGPLEADPADRFTVVRLGIAALHLGVALLVLRRASLQQLGAPWQLLSALPALVISGLALSLAPPPHGWAWAPQLIFALGVLLTLVSFGFLGRNFAIVPALRGLSTTGPYGLVRHPAYLGELMMLAACALAGPWQQAWPLALALPLVALRIAAEERLLAAAPSWESYRGRVRWRLVPLIW